MVPVSVEQSQYFSKLFVILCWVGKCVNIPGGFECYCPFGKTGIRCERDVVIYEPRFSSSGFMAYPTPEDLKNLKMALKIKPDTDADGLLMYASQTNDGLGDYTSLAVRDKRYLDNFLDFRQFNK